MKTAKQLAQEVIEDLPDDASIDAIVEQLQFRSTILRRGEDAARGVNVISHEEAVRRLDKWLKSTGT